ncbi:hypothetical protein PRIPAC_94478 [Pristionchus pacificus]|uniref:Uncharacterized protein n=1 Tax=Pristionchus pacificus TaxID=54126 RepID=A0A2A6BIK1_PRIPA|nr:hypothetical protein PRIPAC_94478 [Pristionchus pacificus]|eukprot:PDM65734.1 hypothetical protein PRIPAC_45648 [Pristionchus pacificus]
MSLSFFIIFNYVRHRWRPLEILHCGVYWSQDRTRPRPCYVSGLHRFRLPHYMGYRFNWTSCFYEPPVAPAVDPSTVDVPAVLYAARDALNNPGLATGKVAHDVTLELLNGRSDFPSPFPPSPFLYKLFYYFHSVAGGDEEMRECTRDAAMDVKPSGVASKGKYKIGPVQHWNLGIGAINCHAWNKDRSQKIKDDSTQAERHNRMMEGQNFSDDDRKCRNTMYSDSGSGSEDESAKLKEMKRKEEETKWSRFR